MTNSPQSPLSFVIDKCGGDSLQHILVGFAKYAEEQRKKLIWPHYPNLFHHIDGDALLEWTTGYEDGIETKEDCRWIFLKDNQPATFLDQSEETKLAIAQLLGFNHQSGEND